MRDAASLEGRWYVLTLQDDIKMDLKELACWLNSTGRRQGPCEHDNEASGSVKADNFIDQQATINFSIPYTVEFPLAALCVCMCVRARACAPLMLLGVILLDEHEMSDQKKRRSPAFKVRLSLSLSSSCTQKIPTARFLCSFLQHKGSSRVYRGCRTSSVAIFPTTR